MDEAPKMYRVTGDPCAVQHPEAGVMVVPRRDQPYPADDPLVIAYPWMFVLEGESRPTPPAPESVPIEQATAAPGERRRTRRSR